MTMSSDDSIPWLKEHTHLLTVGGSLAYGTYTDASDVDVKGVAIPPIQYFIGMGPSFRFADKPMHVAKFRDDLSEAHRERADRTKLEGSIYDLREFIRLASDCNPNILDVLFCRDEEVVIATDIGRELRAQRKLFLSRVARYRFAGYALSQLRRIMGHYEWLTNPPSGVPTREEFGLKPKPEIPQDQLHAVMASVRKQLDRWSSGFVDDLDEHAKARVKEGIAQFLAELRIGIDARFVAAARHIGLEENFIEYLKKEREFDGAMKRWKSYLDWKAHRNEDRAKLEAQYGYDTKHAMHLVRLMDQGRQVITTGDLDVWTPNRDRLMAVRNGEWTYERLVGWAEQEDAEHVALMETSPLPDGPPRKKIDELVQRLIRQSLGI